MNNGNYKSVGMKTLKYILSIIFLAIGLLALLGAIYYQLTNPERTYTQLFFDNWYLYLIGGVFMWLSIVKLKFFEEYK